MKRNPLVSKLFTSASRAVVLATLLFMPGVGSAEQEKAFDPTMQPTLSAQDTRLLVTMNREACVECPSASRFLFQVKDRGTDTTRSFELENETAQVDEIHLSAERKLVVLGRVLANTSIVTILDIQTGQSIDSFFCFRPEVSPNGQFLAFQKVYPAHFTTGVSAQYLIYDLRATHRENRGFGIPFDNRIDVGRPIFPEGAQNRPADNINVPPENQHAMASDHFYWTSDSSRVMFVDRAQGHNWLIGVDVSAWPRKPEVNTALLPKEEIVEANRCEEFRGRLELAFHVIGITEGEGKSILLRFRSLLHGCLRRETLAITLDGD